MTRRVGLSSFRFPADTLVGEQKHTKQKCARVCVCVCVCARAHARVRGESKEKKGIIWKVSARETETQQ
jgi:hypothetical protein